MKKLFLLLFLPLLTFGQATFDEGIRITGGQPTVTSSTAITTTEADGTQGKILGENISLSIIPPPTHYTPQTANVQGHLKGIDNAIGNIVQTTAGTFSRINFTADQTTISAGTFFLTNTTNKGTVAAVKSDVINNDDQKKYFTQDLIGNAFTQLTTFPAGVFAGQLTVSTTPNSALQRFTVELYKCNNAGTPIASGISGAPTGSLGVTVVVILDSGQINLNDGSITGVPVYGNLASLLTINVGERIRYHVSAEKIGTAGGNITESVYYGSNYSSYLDVTITADTNSVLNRSTVSGVTATNALDALNVGKANDSGVLHNSGNESFTGTKTSSGTSYALNLINTGTTGTASVLYNNTSAGASTDASNNGSGYSHKTTNLSTGIGNYTLNGSSSSSSVGIYATSTIAGTSIYSTVDSSSNSIVSNASTAATGFVYVGQNSGTNTFTVNKTGDVNCARVTSTALTTGLASATAFATVGGTVNQFVTGAGTLVDQPLSGSVVWSPGAIAAGGSVGQVVPISGLSLSDVVALGIPSTSVINGLLFTAWVVDANNVGINIKNVSAGSITPPSATYKVKVFK